MEQPREPKFLPNEQPLPVGIVNNNENTLQSIDNTLKRIEKILMMFTCKPKKIHNR